MQAGFLIKNSVRETDEPSSKLMALASRFASLFFLVIRAIKKFKKNVLI